MRSPPGLDDSTSPLPSRESDGDGDGDQTISDEATQKLLKGVIIVMAAIVVIGLFAGAAIWALDGDNEPAAPMNAVDVGFLHDMLDHHEQALLISNLYIDNNPDGDAVPYAEEIIMFQTRDMGWMRDWLADGGYTPGEPDRMAMQWMNEPVPVAEMTGMQTPERLAELADANGADADRLFFEIMTDHHLGGVHMADHAAANGARQEIIDFAESVSRNQRIEVVEYEGAVRRLGLA